MRGPGLWPLMTTTTIPRAAPNPMVTAPSVRPLILALLVDDGVPTPWSAPAGAVIPDATPLVQGQLEGAAAADERVQILNAGRVLGEAVVDPLTSAWSCRLALAPTAGTTYTLTARLVGPTGLVGPVSAGWSFRLDTVAPLAPRVALVLDSGVSTSDGVTSDPRLRVTGLEVGATWEWSVNGGVLWTAGVGSGFSLSTDGLQTVQVRQRDAAGWVSPPSPGLTVQLDRRAPSTVASLDQVPVGTTGDPRPLLRGRLSAPLAADEQVVVLQGSSLLGLGVPDPDRLGWSLGLNLAPTAGSTIAVTVAVRDLAGNRGPLAPARSFILDTVAPTTSVAITDVVDDAGPVTGSVAPGVASDDATPTVRGTVAAALGRGEQVVVFDGDQRLAVATVNATTRTWSATLDLPASPGRDLALTARVVDAAGWMGPASAPRSFRLDTQGDWSYDWAGAAPLAGAPGVQLARVTVPGGRPLAATCLRIDLTTANLRLWSSDRIDGWIDGQRETLTQTSVGAVAASRAGARPLVAAVNADGFRLTDGTRSVPTDLRGLAVSGGVVVSSGSGAATAPVFLRDPLSGARILPMAPAGLNPATLEVAVAGFSQVLRQGIVQGDALTQSARTGLGLSADGRQLLLLTLDRRLDLSAPGGLVGATAWEVGAVLQGFGAWDGLNLDGGGSTQMAWWNPAAGQAQVLNAPLQERYVGQSLGVGYW